MSRYTHLELNRDILAPAGYYTPRKEVRLKHDRREVLYVLSHAMIDSSCCGKAEYCQALVPGYIVKWQAEINKEGLPVSEVEPISDEPVRDRIRKIIRDTENITQTEFW